MVLLSFAAKNTNLSSIFKFNFCQGFKDSRFAFNPNPDIPEQIATKAPRHKAKLLVNIHLWVFVPLWRKSFYKILRPEHPVWRIQSLIDAALPARRSVASPII
jgi:hypothetical protein